MTVNKVELCGVNTAKLPLLKEEEKEEHGKDEEHDDHEEERAPYEARVVEIIAKDDQYVAVKGLKAGERYVSDKSYYVKSMLLKAAIGEHGH